MDHPQLKAFMTQSLMIEGIDRSPTDKELAVTIEFLGKSSLKVGDLEMLQQIYAPGHRLRTEPHLNVRVGAYVAPRGGPQITERLATILDSIQKGLANSYQNHVSFELLHPFTDGNGRVGRALWLWDRLNRGLYYMPPLLFLHQWYYDSLRENQ